MRIQFDYGWYTPQKSVMRYTARDGWTWKDFHAVVHVSQFAMMQQPAPIHTLIDLSATGVGAFPSGIGAHARTFGKRHSAALSGQAVVIGVPADALQKLNLGADGTFKTADGFAVFVQTEPAAREVLRAWGVELAPTE